MAAKIASPGRSADPEPSGLAFCTGAAEQVRCGGLISQLRGGGDDVGAAQGTCSSATGLSVPAVSAWLWATLTTNPSEGPAGPWAPRGPRHPRGPRGPFGPRRPRGPRGPRLDPEALCNEGREEDRTPPAAQAPPPAAMNSARRRKRRQARTTQIRYPLSHHLLPGHLRRPASSGSNAQGRR